jgi:hypothetical protein
MCVIAAKYLEDYNSWCLVKCRDRNYKCLIFIKQNSYEGTEACYIKDAVTAYSDGVNEYGVAIVTASTSNKSDSTEGAAARKAKKNKAKREGTYVSPDGIKIRHALRLETATAAINLLIENKFIGNVLCADQDTCYLLEGGYKKKDLEYNKKMAEQDPEWEWESMDYDYTLVNVDKKDYIARTNHGIFKKHLGYSAGSTDEKEVSNRKSSETRHEVAIKNLKGAATPEEMLEAISDTSNEDPQLNPVRLDKQRGAMRTTGQLMMLCKKRLLVYVPIWCDTKTDHNFNKINSENTKTFFELRHFRKLEESKNEIMCFEDFKFNYLNKEEIE